MNQKYNKTKGGLDIQKGNNIRLGGKMYKKIILMIACLLFSSFWVIGVGIETDELPHKFYGLVTTNGNSAPDNIQITAKIDGNEVQAGFTKDGYYGQTGNKFMVPAGGGDHEGKTVEFFVESSKVAEFIFKTAEITTLNLDATGDFCGDSSCTGGENNGNCPLDCPVQSPQPTGGGSSSPSLGGGGSMIIPTTVDEPEPETSESTECKPNWKCSDWLDCFEGKEKRVCVQANDCESDDPSPATVRSCEVKKVPIKKESSEVLAEPEGGFINWITAAVVGGGTGGILVPLGIVILLGLGTWGYIRYKRK